VKAGVRAVTWISERVLLDHPLNRHHRPRGKSGGPGQEHDRAVLGGSREGTEAPAVVGVRDSRRALVALFRGDLGMKNTEMAD
jgi:hypothetical protein